MKKTTNRNSNLFTINHVRKEILGTKTALEKASVYDSKEYKLLMEIMNANPSYTVTVKEIKKNASKKSYKGLSLEKMENYIKTQPNAEQNLIKFNAVKRIAETKGSKYPLTKKWFLKTFPEFKENEVENETSKLEDELTKELEKRALSEVEEIESEDLVA